MATYKVAIIGGSIGGLTSALVLASAINETLDFEISIIDEGGKKADIFKAEAHNVPLFPRGIDGEEILKKTKEQIASFTKVQYITASVNEIAGSKGDFLIQGEGVDLKAHYVIVATGATQCNIKGLESAIKPHPLMNKPGKIMLASGQRNEIKPGVYVAGIASGATTMITCAMGSAAESACAILSDIDGSVVVIHDSKGTRK